MVDYFTLLTLTMGYNVRIAAYSFLLILHCCPCCPDEYQLTAFIVHLKTTQFLSSGLFAMMVGALQYYYCISGRKDDVLVCVNEDGLGAFHLASCLLDYAGCGLLTWTAVFAMRRATEVIKPSFIGLEADPLSPEPVASSSSGPRPPQHRRARNKYMTWFVSYDLVTFAASICLLICISVVLCRDLELNSASGTWEVDMQFKANAFWCRVLYSLSMFPFIFTISPLSTFSFSLLTDARASGFNAQGMCVAWQLSAQRPQQEKCVAELPSHALPQ